MGPTKHPIGFVKSLVELRRTMKWAFEAILGEQGAVQLSGDEDLYLPKW